MTASIPQDCLDVEPLELEAASSLLVIMHTLDQTVSVQDVSLVGSRASVLPPIDAFAGYT